MARLVRIINGDLAIAHRYVATPTYTIFTADYSANTPPPHDWKWQADDPVREDFALPWKQPVGAVDAYAQNAVVTHNGTRWRSLVAANVWVPGVSAWADISSATPVWIQPTGAHDAYALGAEVMYQSEVYKSTLAANVWAPNVIGWKKTALTPPPDPGSAPAVPNWVQPTGAHDAYALNARVMHNGFQWNSTVAANVWEPGVFGWTQV